MKAANACDAAGPSAATGEDEAPGALAPTTRERAPIGWYFIGCVARPTDGASAPDAEASAYTERQPGLPHDRSPVGHAAKASLSGEWYSGDPLSSARAADVQPARPRVSAPPPTPANDRNALVRAGMGGV